MKLIVCLGNPGPEYKKNRHNVGFMIADTLIKKNALSKEGSKFQSKLYRGHIGGKSIMLIMPQTYMNRSGDAVQLTSGFYRIPTENTWIIYDDIDLPLGSLRVRTNGSAGTHNGMKSILNTLKNHGLPRIRVGIGPVPDNTDISQFVLSDFSKKELALIPKICDQAADALHTALNATEIKATSYRIEN